MIRGVNKRYLLCILVPLLMSTQMSSMGPYDRYITICSMKKIACLLQALSLGISRILLVFQFMINMKIDSYRRRIPSGIVLPLIQNMQIGESMFSSMSRYIFSVKCMSKSMVCIQVFGRRWMRSMSQGLMILLCRSILNNSMRGKLRLEQESWRKQMLGAGHDSHGFYDLVAEYV